MSVPSSFSYSDSENYYNDQGDIIGSVEAPATSSSTTTTTQNYNAPPGEGPNQQDPANTVMAEQTPSKIADPNWTAKPFNIMDASTWVQSAPMIDNPVALPPGSVGSDVNTNLTPRDSVEQVTQNTQNALAPAPTAPSAPSDPTSNAPPPPPPAEMTRPKVTSPVYEAQGGKMLKAAEDSYGLNAADTMRMAMLSGADFGNMAAAEGGRNATGYARASGLSPAQAALMAGQGAEGAYNTGLGQGVDKYMGAAKDISSLGLGEQGQGLQKYGLDLGKYATELGDETQRYGIDKGVDSQNASNWMSMLGTGVSALAPVFSALAPILFSDENAKTDVRDGYGLLASVTKSVGPKAFKYKSGLGQDSGDQVGVMAQDLEKTPLKSAVSVDPQTGLKKVDTGKVTMGNTAMITELSQKLDKVFDYLKAAK